jgi:predicted DNA-binding transcriptional regulator AlpA
MMTQVSPAKAQTRESIAHARAKMADTHPKAVSEYVSDRSGAVMLDCSRASWWRRVQDGTLPQPVKIGGLTRWRRADVLAAVARLSGEGV